jgi:hypothetical protein
MNMLRMMRQYSGTAEVSKATLLLRTTSLLAVMAFANPAWAGNHTSGAFENDSTADQTVAGHNTEQEEPDNQPAAGFAISVDGQVVAGSKSVANRQRKTDLALEAVDIQVKFDGLATDTALNVSTVPVRRAYAPGEEINFLSSLNYGGWVTRGEVRIFSADRASYAKPLAIIPVSEDGAATWRMPATGPAEIYYVFRVYDDKGRFDETKPLSLLRSEKPLDLHEPQDATAPGYGEDRTAIRNIGAYGGMVTVFGSRVPDGVSVIVMGERVPVDAEGKFLVQRILPPGDHHVLVKLDDGTRKGLEFDREINIPSNEWFYVALADVTAGYRFGDKDIADVKPGEFDKIYTKGRLAFYLKGKIKGRTILTAAADTGEDRIENLFKGLDAKDPRQFLRRIDPDDYYPVYGDDSTQIEDAPTRGKFYVRLERGDSHVMWGNFKTHIDGTRFLRNERALYGAEATIKSETQAPDGDRTSELTAYAAQPGTLPQRDVLRGTGGSAYFLKHQDVTIGSETVNVEVRDRISSRVISRRPLRYGIDYDIDYVQGLIILRRPLASTTSNTDAVRDGALGGHPQNLTVSYEFTPAAGDVKGYVYGGRAQQWIGEHVRVGVTGMQEKTGSANQTLYGADLRLRMLDGTYVEGEYAVSKGPGFGKSTSSDGGLTISDEATAGRRGRTAEAYRAELHADLGELSKGSVKGDFQGHYDHYQGGFSSLDEQVDRRKESWGASATAELSERAKAKVSYEEAHTNKGRSERELAAETSVKLNDHVTLTPGVRNSMRRDAVSSAKDIGERTDVGAKLLYAWEERRNAYVFGQATVARSGDRRRNNRAGIGGETQFTEKVSGTGEVSYGDGGFGLLAELAYSPTADDRYYAGYRLDPDRSGDIDRAYDLSGTDLGKIIAGARHHINDEVAVFAEDSYDLFGDRRTLTQAYGVDYTPNARWTFSGAGEWGFIEDTSINAFTGIKNSDFDRKAFSLSAGYKGENDNTGRVKGEIRLEDSDDNSRDMTSYLLAATVGLKANDDWRLLANFDAVISEATTTTRDGEYVESAFGYAYRPVENDRLNGLFKYTFLYDLPGADQVTVNGTTRGPAQLSHILSADVSYDVTPVLTLGAKYGFRIGEIRERTAGSDWEKGSAHLGVLRADVNFVKDWDALVEGRVLWVPEAHGVDYGALAAVYRHVGENFKIGVGYNFGSFTDDLRDLTYDDHGVFVNAIGKF